MCACERACFRVPGRGCAGPLAPAGAAGGSFLLLDLDQVPHGMQHAACLLGVLHLHGVADPAQAQRAQRVDLLLVGAVLRAPLGDL